MILVDANIFMYAAGASHPHKAPSSGFLAAVARGNLDAAVDAECLQEILHRYRAIRRWDDGRRVYDLARRIVPVVVPVTAEIVDRARELLDEVPGLSARDALHATVCRSLGAEICSYDEDFDQVPGLVRRVP